MDRDILSFPTSPGSRIPEIYPILYFIVSLDIPTFIVMQQQHNISTLHNLIWRRVSIQSRRRKKCTRNSHRCANQTCKFGRFKQSHFDKLPVVIFQKKMPKFLVKQVLVKIWIFLRKAKSGLVLNATTSSLWQFLACLTD